MYYSDGFFKTNPNDYQPHMATLACQLTHASTTYINGNDYSKGDKQIRDALTTLGFDSIYTTDTYTKKPTVDSIACAIAKKDITDVKDSKYKYAVDITVRSANYEAEWANNVKLGKKGEAEGFGGSANKIVANYLPDFLKAKPKVEDALNKGEVAFFVNGYSRGGATANIAAKKLVDEYQSKGNAVYAYCIEAPQGGVASLENPKVDYGCIHNVVNPNDLVCYVGPTKMGFKRYGVDHFVCGTPTDSKNLQKGTIFEALTDNKFDAIAYEKAGEINEDEFKRKVRMNRMILRGILPNIKILNIFSYHWFSYFYFGHRTCRYLLWIMHLIALAVNIPLAVSPNWFWRVIMIIQILFYIVAIIGCITKSGNRLVKIVTYYCMTVMAQWKGVFNIITGKSKPTWDKAESTR